MPIELDDPSGPPYIAFPAMGTYVDVAIIKLEVIPWIDAVTGKVKKDDNDKDRTQELLTALVVQGTAGTGKRGGDKLPIGEAVRIFIAGQHRWAFGEAKAAHKATTGTKISVGDFMRIKYDHDEPGQFTVDKKVWTFQIRAPRPEESERTAKCEQLHRGATAVPAGAPSGQQSRYGDDDPFD